MSDAKKKLEIATLKGLYTTDQETNAWIYRDRCNARLHKTYKITLATIVGCIPAIGTIFGYVTKLLV